MQPGSRTLIWTLLLAASYPRAQTLLPLDQAFANYEEGIAAAEATAEPRSIESALAAVEDLEEALLAHIPGGDLAVLEGLSEADYARLENLPGVLVQRVEILVVRPAAEFFVALAARAGNQADRRFAAALFETYGNGYWPAYVERQTHYSGCTAFGEGRLLEINRVWSAMERDFPGRYASAVARERAAVGEEITRSTCACGDEASAVGELERIAAALTPADPMLPTVLERLAALGEGRSDIRFGCISG